VTALAGHAVLVGHGRVGSLIGAALRERGVPVLVIEESEARVASLREEGVEVIQAQAGMPGILVAANLRAARYLVSAIPNPFEASSLIAAARTENPGLIIVARAHSDAEVEHLKHYGADHIVLGEREIAREMAIRLFADEAAHVGTEDGELAPDGDAFDNARRKLA
jgi:CPA2 family monovalent cation:H+ antiporter-2